MMGHNISVKGRIVFIFSLCLTLFFTPLFSQPASNRTFDKRGAAKTKSNMDEIDRAWMNSIQKEQGNRPTPVNPKESKDKKDGKKNNIKVENPSESTNKEGEDIPAITSPDVQVQTQTADTNESALFPQEDTPSFISLFFRFVMVGGVMFGLFYIVIRFLKKQSQYHATSNELITIIASVPLLPGKFLQIVDLAGTLMVLATSDKGVEYMTGIDDPAVIHKIRLYQSEEESRPQTSKNPWIRWTSLLKNTDYRFWIGEKGEPNLSEQEKFSSMLKGLGASPYPKNVSTQQSSLYREEESSLYANFNESKITEDEEFLKTLLNEQKSKIRKMKRTLSSEQNDAQ